MQHENSKNYSTAYFQQILIFLAKKKKKKKQENALFAAALPQSKNDTIFHTKTNKSD